MVTAKQGVQFSKRVGQAIARHRLAKGLTQDDVATAIGVEQETISRFERGATLPTLMRLIDIAELLQVPLDLLVRAGSSRAVDVAVDLTAMLDKLTPQNREAQVILPAAIQFLPHNGLATASSGIWKSLTLQEFIEQLVTIEKDREVPSQEVADRPRFPLK